MTKRIGSALLATLCILCATAQQVEREEALHFRPAAKQPPALARSAGLNEIFLYQYLPQELPVVDDFSIDRTRHLGLASGDPGVTLIETWYRLEVNGSTTAGLAFSLDTTRLSTYDPVEDTTIFTPQPPITVLLRDLDVYPTTTELVDMWPAYALIDTIGDADQDTVFLQPDIVQDSLLVYQVAADTRTYVNPDNSTRPLVLWEEDHAYVNGTFAVDPPTIGVASFDGLDRTGYPYAPENPNTQGIADLLTSVPIDLAVPPADSVYLSFFYQARGFSGDSQNNATDSLRLELFAAEPVNAWRLVWSVPYPLEAPQPFRQVMIPITDPELLKEGFRMRFSNRGQLGGQVDVWHIDYVRLGTDRSLADTVLQDVAFTYPARTLLSPYTSVPFAKFTASPASYMAVNVDLQQKNLDTDDKFITWGYELGTTCGSTASFANYGSNISANAGTTFNSAHPVNSAPNNFIYDLSGCTADAFADVVFWTNATPDALVYNDSTRFLQEISNYYAYDDGTAEAGYSLNQTGARLAQRYDTQGDDSLRAVRFYFDPIFTYGDIPNDPRDGNFLITVWGADLNSPPIFQNVSFSSPEYRQWGPNYFVEYPLDSVIPVSGTFHVGWQQTSAVKMNLGFDKNRDNSSRQFYYVDGSWTQSQLTGTWMLRPVMVSATDPFAGVDEPTAEQAVLRLFPNPAQDSFTVRYQGPAAVVELLDPTGRVLGRERWRAELPWSMREAAPGLYLVRVLAADGRMLAQERLVLQR
jgi:hypothetical protein